MRGLRMLLLVGLAAACGGNTATSPGASVPFDSVTHASVSGVVDPARRAIRSPSDWEDVWAQINSGLQPVPALPQVDFDRETLVLAAAGRRANACYAIEITAAEMRSDGAVVLDIQETVPGSSCGCLQVETHPVHVVKLGLLSSRELFVDRSPRQSC